MRYLLVLIAVFFLSVSVRAQPKLDEDRLLFHVKETFNIPAGVEAKLGTPEKSGIPGLWKVKLTLSRGGQTQERTILVSEDGARYVVGDVAELSKLPDPENLARLKTAGAPSKGPEGAKITIVEFTDFQCPYCKRAHEAIEENLFKTYGDRVRLVFKHFPLGMHPWAQPAGVAAACVHKIKPSAFWKFADAVFREQDTINQVAMGSDHRSYDADKFRTKILELAKAAGVDGKKLSECYDKKETLEVVKQDVAEGDAMAINSTPTLFVNGHRMVGFGGFEQLKALVDEMLAGTHGPPASKKN